MAKSCQAVPSAECWLSGNCRSLNTNSIRNIMFINDEILLANRQSHLNLQKSQNAVQVIKLSILFQHSNSGTDANKYVIIDSLLKMIITLWGRMHVFCLL